MWDPKYDVAYFVVCVMGLHLEVADVSGNTWKVSDMISHSHTQ